MVQLVSLFKSYFGGDLNEANIQNNFVLIYELLDEAMDFGLPQITDPTILKSLIFQKGSSIDFFEASGDDILQPYVPLQHAMVLWLLGQL
jgi:AP-2 complex subunit mu-1